MEVKCELLHPVRRTSKIIQGNTLGENKEGRKVVSNSSFKSSNQIKRNPNSEIKTQKNLSILLNKKEEGEKEEEREEDEESLKVSEECSINLKANDFPEKRSLTSDMNENFENFLSKEQKEEIFRLHVEKSIKNIELTMDLRKEKIFKKKTSIRRKSNQLFFEILVEMDKLLERLVETAQEEVYRLHFHNIFSFKRENKTIQGESEKTCTSQQGTSSRSLK